jgi:hypothetical protein
MPTTFPLRLDPALTEKIKKQAAIKKISANKLMIHAINLYLETKKEKEWREGFEAMGRDPDTNNNVDFALPAAREIIFGD